MSSSEWIARVGVFNSAGKPVFYRKNIKGFTQAYATAAVAARTRRGACSATVSFWSEHQNKWIVAGRFSHSDIFGLNALDWALDLLPGLRDLAETANENIDTAIQAEWLADRAEYRALVITGVIVPRGRDYDYDEYL